jgi:hypothetical protein
MTRKFISGMALYAQLWDGPVRALLNVVPGSPALDNVEVDPSDLPFQAIPVSFERQDFYPHLQGVAVALGGPHYQLHGWVKRALAMGVQPVSCVEYSLQTRLDIARAEGASTFQRSGPLCSHPVQWYPNVRHLPLHQRQHVAVL